MQCLQGPGSGPIAKLPSHGPRAELDVGLRRAQPPSSEKVVAL